jgi:hypothetical protein
MAKKAFDFGDNPVSQFISGAPSPGTHTPTTIETGSRASYTGKDKKDKRICVMIQSALYDDIAKIARVKGISRNEIFCRAAKEYRDNERRDLERYKAIFEDMEG